jgi:phenylalanyl-tRNA synthetase beta chain
LLLPISWLKTLTDLDVSIEAYIEDITMSGSKVEAVSLSGYDLEKIVAGRILSIEKHSNSDHLLIAKVDAGDGMLQIVTGAPNIYVGALVPIALDGGSVHGGQRIKKGKLRGEWSEGMMCSIDELGYTRQDYPEAPEDGIYIFPESCGLKPGDDAVSALMLKDETVEFEITSNRPDCNSIIGLARETAATYSKPLNLAKISLKEEAPGDIGGMISVEIMNPDLCPRYIARVVTNASIGPSPLWMRHRLSACGIRPINNIVDITNYVMLEYGQPMHAFDIDSISGRKIIIRTAHEGESFTTLDGASHTLDPSILVISDCDKAVAAAGVMGGENSKVTGNATAILFESANFNGTSIRLASKRLGLRTDASSRYEKGLDPNLALDAVNRAVQLVEELGCGKAVKGMVDCYPNRRDPLRISFLPEKINKLLGTDISAEDMIGFLERLEIRVEGAQALIPTFRADIETSADLAEEVARLYGYGNIPATLYAGSPSIGVKTRKQGIFDLIKAAAASLGYSEAMTYSFESPKVFDKLSIPGGDPRRNAVKILNPIGSDYSIMRTSMENSMLTSLSLNFSRRNDGVRLFEAAKIYIPKGLPLSELPDEVETLAIGSCGEGDFFELKGAVEEVLSSIGIIESEFSPIAPSHMHPGRCAEVSYKGSILGYLGEIHPQTAQRYSIDSRVMFASLNMDKMAEFANLRRAFKPLPKFPALQRDISVLARDDVSVGAMKSAIREKGGSCLEAVELFDVYKGKQIEDGFKSVAFSLSFRADDRTLKDEEVNIAMKSLLANLEEKLGARLRDK